MKSSSLILLAVLVICTLAGCGGGGGGSTTLPATETTISGQIEVPAVDNGLLGAVSYATDEALLQKIADSGTCTVNGKSTAFTLVPATHYFSVSEIPVATFYEVKFTYEGVELRMISPHSSTYISKKINLSSTAEAMLIDKYGIDKSTLSDVAIKDEWKDYLAGKLLTQYQTVGITRDAFESFFSTEMASFTKNVPLNTLTTVLTPAVDLTGTWKTAIPMKYYTLNGLGERAAEVTANATLTVKQSGNSLSGTLELDVISWTKVAGSDAGYTPIDEGIDVTGTISSTQVALKGQFTSAALEATSDLLRGKLINTDDYANLGLETDENGLNLVKQK
ncbi:MAG: hypothetical protein CVV42_07885 [Candidatus Riflebacteria bacterium HGW-Riflebacteria-2]|jgi:hypothetical protein|nr:MAG: hypothetical protein CVV42_07885 [Candidatus Riflebacteria bacterium HGW-Riflebacteria-2]